MGTDATTHHPPPLLAHRLVYVTGKGGVGKSTVAAALGRAAVGRGRRTVVADVHRREDVEHAPCAGGADRVAIDPQRAMEEYLVDQLPVRPLADLLAASPAFAYLAAATPGMRELLAAGKLWELAQDERRTPGAPAYDLVVVDAPATGHGLAVLTAPRTFAAAARVGPIARQGRIIDDMLSDPARTAVVAVTTPEELPVTETLALRDALHTQTGLDLTLVVANAVRPLRLSDAEAARLAPHAARPAVRAALAEHARARAARAQLERLRTALDGEVAVAELPFLPAGAEGHALGRLARELEASL